MRPSVTVRNAVVAAAALALAAVPGTANATTTWSVTHPPYTAIDNEAYSATLISWQLPNNGAPT